MRGAARLTIDCMRKEDQKNLSARLEERKEAYHVAMVDSFFLCSDRGE